MSPGHTVCSRAERRDSSKAVLLANGDTAAIFIIIYLFFQRPSYSARYLESINEWVVS